MLALTLVLVAAGSAVAHDTPANCKGVYYGGTQRGVACTAYSHTRVDGCDRQSDGLRARAWAYIPYEAAMSWDPNGANSGCAHDYFPAGVTFHRICVEHPVGCSEYVPS